MGQGAGERSPDRRASLLEDDGEGTTSWRSLDAAAGGVMEPRTDPAPVHGWIETPRV